MVHAYHTAWYHDPDDHSMNVCETVLESTSSLSDYLVSHIPSVWLGPKTSTFRYFHAKYGSGSSSQAPKHQ